MNRQEGEARRWKLIKRRTLGIAALVLLLMVPLVIRLHQLQVVQGDEFLRQTERQYKRLVVTPPVRGQIFSSDGVILAGNRAHYDLTLHPSEARNPRGINWTSSDMLKYTTKLEESVMKRKSLLRDIGSLRWRMHRDMAHPVVLFEDLSKEEIAKCVELMPRVPGMSVTPRIEREYSEACLASHLIGISRWKEIPIPRMAYSVREIHGNSGLEAKFDRELAGNTGIKTVLIDPSGFTRDELEGAIAKIDGLSLKLTIDSKAQAAAEQALMKNTGALVAINPKNGAVIAMASSPTFNLAELTTELYADLLRDKADMPLFNRATLGTYMPGSIVKPLLTLYGLENGLLTTESTYECRGYYQIGDVKIGCAKRSGHGVLSLLEAIAVSCNPYFINEGLECKVEGLNALYTAAGFGKRTGFELVDAAGAVPSEETARRFFGRGWLRIDTAYASIGQGGITVTPLQAACYTAALANGGKLWRPFVVWQMLDNDGNVVRETPPLQNGSLPASAENLEFVRNAMIEAVSGENTSANAMQASIVPLAAKTGTAEVGEGPKKHKNTWIICYGPLPEPTFAVACVIEHGASGGRTTAPVVVDFINTWLE
ncbi:MAG: hypothetical protein J5833_03985 [Victivallales bacterium]|nr:hypothetical protein [Victivallales bacterium]